MSVDKAVDLVEDDLSEDGQSSSFEVHTLNQLNSLLKVEKGRKRTASGRTTGKVSCRVEDSPDFNVRLLREVRSRPFLFDTAEEAYNNPAWRTAAWQDISSLLGVTPEIVRTRWKTLRDRFKKEVKKADNGSRPSSWAFYQSMTFILPHLKEKAGIHYPVLSDSCQDGSPPFNYELLEDVDMDKTQEIPSGTEQETPQQTSPPSAREDEEDEVFGHMIALKLSKMEPRRKEMVKLRLLQTLFDAQFG